MLEAVTSARFNDHRMLNLFIGLVTAIVNYNNINPSLSLSRFRRKASSRGHGAEASKKSSRISRAAREHTAVPKQINNAEVSLFSYG